MNKHNFIKQLKYFLQIDDDVALNSFCLKYKRSVIPNRLYRYTTITKHTLVNLVSNQVCLNNPRSFNDPFDCWSHKILSEVQVKPNNEIILLFEGLKQKYNLNVSLEEFNKAKGLNSLQAMANMLPIEKRNNFIQSVKPSLESLIEKTHDDINLCLDRMIRVSCFTEYPPTKLLMWSHYADYHKGLCLEYDLKDCDDETFCMLMPIIYQFNLQLQKDDVKLSDFTYSRLLQMILIKSKEWSYEKEWRLIKSLDFPSSEREFHKFPYLKHIYVGAGASNDCLLLEIVNFAHSDGIPISKMFRNDNDFSLHGRLMKCP